MQNTVQCTLHNPSASWETLWKPSASCRTRHNRRPHGALAKSDAELVEPPWIMQNTTSQPLCLLHNMSQLPTSFRTCHKFPTSCRTRNRSHLCTTPLPHEEQLQTPCIIQSISQPLYSLENTSTSACLMLRMSQLSYLVQSKLLYNWTHPLSLMENTSESIHLPHAEHCTTTTPPQGEHVTTSLPHGEHLIPPPHGEHVTTSLPHGEHVTTLWPTENMLQHLCLMENMSQHLCLIENMSQHHCLTENMSQHFCLMENMSQNLCLMENT